MIKPDKENKKKKKVKSTLIKKETKAKKKGRLLKLFASTFLLSLFTFGGGFVIVAMMKKKFVDEYAWIDEEEMLDLVAIAQSSPGAVAINTSIILGYRIKGITGALVSIAGTVLPPLGIITLISFAYDAFKDNINVVYVMQGLRGGIAAVMVSAVWTMILSVTKRKKAFDIIVLCIAFILGMVFNVNVIYLLLASGLAGLIITYKEALVLLLKFKGRRSD